MIRFASEQVIDRSADEVWRYAADIERHPEWMDVTDARVTDGDGTALGSRGIEWLKRGSRSVAVDVEVTASEPGRRIAWTVGGQGPLRGDVALELETVGPNRTRAVWSGSLGLSGLMRLVEPLMAAELRSGEARELRRLKQNLEAETSQPVATAS